MPPHCDSLDGPVVRAASLALEKGDVNVVLPYVPKTAEDEILATFEKVGTVRQGQPEAKELVDRFFFETVVRLHRAGEGAPFTGLKPDGLDVGPVIPVAERAIDNGSVTELTALLCSIVRDELDTRFQQVMCLKRTAGKGVDEAREYVSAMLGLQVYAQSVYRSLKAGGHERHSQVVDE